MFYAAVAVSFTLGALLGISYGKYRTLFGLYQAAKAGRCIILSIKNGKVEVVGGEGTGVEILKQGVVGGVTPPAPKKDESVN